MANLNKIILVGRLTTDPDLRTTMDAIPIAKFQLAVERNAGMGGQKETDFVDIIAWRNIAEICGNHLKKGQLALVEGRIQNRSFETKEGVKRYATEVVANNVVPMEKGKNPQKIEIDVPEIKEGNAEESFLEDDLPF